MNDRPFKRAVAASSFVDVKGDASTGAILDVEHVSPDTLAELYAGVLDLAGVSTLGDGRVGG